LFRDLALHATPAEVRRELHARALALFQDEQAPLEVLAEHAVLAQDSMTALFFLEQVAERAHAYGDEQTASFVLRRGLEIARQELYRGQLDDPMRAIAIFGRRLGLTLIRIGQFSDAEGVLLEALDSTDERAVERVEVLRLLSDAACQRQRLGDAERYLSQALRYAEAESAQHPSLAASVRSELTEVRLRSSRG
jgi:serine/threonine-protein kinase